MKWSWIDLIFPWIGAAAASLVLVLLFSTGWLQADPNRSRWRDTTWLSWLAVAIYLIHNVEEYGRDLLGHLHAFPTSMCAALGQPSYPLCPIPPPFYLAVNLPLFWLGAPAAALVSRRHPIVGLSLYGVIFVNALAHTKSLLAGYNPGACTAVVLFLPASLWVAKSCFGPFRLPYRVLAFIVADGLLLHIVLIGSTMMFFHGLLRGAALIGLQGVNAIVFFALAWMAEKCWKQSLPVIP